LHAIQESGIELLKTIGIFLSSYGISMETKVLSDIFIIGYFPPGCMQNQ